jgi:predicted PhzF superfamily epimerase YddE/YHI9
VLRPFRQVDVFTTTPYRGNPVAVVLDGSDLTTEQMQRVAHWTNLSETTFVLPPTDPGADYRVRIFTAVVELPFAGHPTLGTCHAWLESGGSPKDAEAVVQECEAGLVRVRRTDDGLAFAAPPLVRSGPVDDGVVAHIAHLLGLAVADIVDAQWVDNGPGWVAVLLRDADAVLAVRPGAVDLDVGVVGPYPPGSAEAFEVRAFTPKDGMTDEDHRQLERVPRRVAAAHRAGRRALCRQPGRSARPGRPGAHHPRRGRRDLGGRRDGDLRDGRDRALGQPPAMAPTTMKGSVPWATC